MKKYEKNLEILDYISLINQIVVVLIDIKFGKENFFTKNNRSSLLREGKGIINEILEGSYFIEKKPSKKGYSPQSITLFDYGIKSIENRSTINNKVKNYTDYSNFFTFLYDKMNDVCSDKSDKRDIILLIDFFKSFNQILKENYNEQRTLESIYSESEKINDFVFN